MADATTERNDSYLLGVDLGGTKIAGVSLSGSGSVKSEKRIPSPRDDYSATLHAIRDLTNEIAADCGLDKYHPVGIGTPGSIDPGTGLLQNANSTWLNDRPFLSDLESCLQRPVRIANDANCFALSEARDGAGRGAKSVFGVIIGTGCGGGLVIDGHIVNGARGIAGEWGHIPLPWANPAEMPGPLCWCGRHGCMETWISGAALEADYRRISDSSLTAKQIAAMADGDPDARTALDDHASRLARGLACMVNLFDPDVIVLGGGLSAMTHLYKNVPTLMAPYIFAREKSVKLLPPAFADASGVRGAARLWADLSNEQQ
ncbi:MAG: ROK family protein [Fimbriimonadaceae bacterium]|nr:ROK family protein [Alphaproteobacteria bacterium]